MATPAPLLTVHSYLHLQGQASMGRTKADVVQELKILNTWPFTGNICCPLD